MFGSIMPEPLAMPPMVNAPRGVCTVTACSFGNGSVVMMARAASLPPSRVIAAAAARMPVTTRSIFSVTPMTPVVATSTCSGGQPTAPAVSSAIRRACVESLRAGAGVGAAAVDDDGAGDAVALLEVLARRRAPAPPAQDSS